MLRANILLIPFLTITLFYSSKAQAQQPTAVNSTYRGDINEDNKVDIFDLLELLKMLSNPAGKPEKVIKIADVNASGSVDIFDLLGLLKILSGAETPGIIYWGPVITFVSIPGGRFQMGSSTGESDEQPVHQVTVSAFQMSTKEITNSQYAVYLNEASAAGEITATSSSVTGSKGDYSGREYIYLSGSYNTNNKCWISYNGTSFSVAQGKENWPVVYVTWYGAKAFSVKYGFDIPREAEWEYAARGGLQNEYGTDDGTISCTKANYWECDLRHPAEVSSYPANPFGLYDLSGNVWEWCNDWSGLYDSANQTDPTGPSPGSLHVFRGGSWYHDAHGCRSSSRPSGYPDGKYFYLGFRVVRR